MISRINKNLPIVLINTHFLFEETLDYKNYLIKKFDLKNYKEIYPDTLDLSCKDKQDNLWKSDPDLCCNIRKVKPNVTTNQNIRLGYVLTSSCGIPSLLLLAAKILFELIKNVQNKINFNLKDT